ncbi:choice-of-anchor tandem repeat GloVer-containing protein [Methylocystis heyeri]|uniref:Uncharacterized protein n=1 Tax=Methylocystis heyeri TaxID=391905 RepID=A0A6B8KAQ8_9HYPH|nr:choice-of-anchor tandem repeat GloVer-containing protein [Methylocystis heyeri]QGM44919.1 hypothetical protein H2LOC_004020 [Methylocystis heyeri]
MDIHNGSILRTLRLASLLVAGASPALAQTWPPAPFSESTLYSFAGAPDGSMPANVTLLTDNTGALYGTTFYGATGDLGTVFKLTPPAPGKSRWTETLLYSFTGGSSGANPNSGLVRDSHGALYGVTVNGGANQSGVAYKLTPPVPPSTQWSYAKIYDFDPYSMPLATPMFDGAGALIGANASGGIGGFGTIYKLTPPPSSGGQWTGSALYSFTGGADGGYPNSTLALGADGAIYGTGQLGGVKNNGVVFKLIPSGTNCTPVSPNLWCETVLYTFTGSDGAQPQTGLVLNNASGVLYGATQLGGANNLGVVFSLTPPVPPSTQWQETVLYSFAGGQDGANPVSDLTMMGGALYGSTIHGGGGSCNGGCGTLFQLLPPAAPAMHWTENVLYRFTGNSDGGWPQGGLTFNALPFSFGLAVYGVTGYIGGASRFGAVFTLQCAKATREVLGGAQHTACVQ